MLYIIGFLVIIVVVIRLNVKYYQLKGNPKDFVMKKKDLGFILEIEVIEYIYYFSHHQRS